MCRHSNLRMVLRGMVKINLILANCLFYVWLCLIYQSKMLEICYAFWLWFLHFTIKNLLPSTVVMLNKTAQNMTK